ncbi:VOC family protein [Sphingopyxis sp. GW247-27LB]|uniref:VOC family protein n=1 Tax=Sphingopyxis sp. GW247-27LB TaxID=2012632 RepID=UPI000BA7D962|nr:VOC family protein [Sphingopyxis sp. GW247-27LB]PAL24219.1 bleomycin resistance protein [Sphingopyxis sp. GW247-27LB]
MAVSDIRYKRLGYIALTVTDLDRSAEFYREMVGVAVERSADGEMVFLRCSDRHHDLVLTRGAAPALKRIGWEMESRAALDAVRAHMQELGIAILPIDPVEQTTLGLGEAFRISEPTTGATFEFYAEMTDAPTPYGPTHTHIARLGHVVLGSPVKSETEAFLMDHLNFRISDRIGPVVTFMRCFPNPYHHSFGVGGGESSTLGHINFMVTDIDDIGRANIRMRNNAVPIVYGPGRHPTSNSVFFYFLDPDGITVEYSFGMEEFPEEAPRDPRLFPVVPESFDSWGGSPEGTFSKIGGVERLDAPADLAS